MKPNKQVIKELEIERDEIKNKNKAAGQMIENSEFDYEQKLLLSMQMSAYKTVTHVLNARIRLLEKQMPAIEEPEKVVLTKEQAEIVEKTRYEDYPASYISEHTGDEEELLMNAYVNGYTVEKDDKRYLVELDGLVTTDGAKQYLTKKDGKWFASRRMSGLHQDFTDEELNKVPEWAQQLNREEMTAGIDHYGLQDCEKEEVTDDEQ